MHKITNLKTGCWRQKGKLPVLLTGMLTGVFLSACAGTAPVPEVAEFSISERAQDRWDAVLARDYETAYSFYTPGYRSATSLMDFALGIRGRRVRWTTAEYKEHDCAENSCTVTFDVGFTVPKPAPGLDKWEGEQEIVEKWVKTDGRWWYLPQK